MTAGFGRRLQRLLVSVGSTLKKGALSRPQRLAGKGRVPSVAVAGSNLTRFSSGLAVTTRAILKSTGKPAIPRGIAPAWRLPE